MAKDLVQSRLEALIKLGRSIPTETVGYQKVGELVTVNLNFSVV